MKTAAPALLLLPLFIACGDAREVIVELDVRTDPCPSSECTVHLIGEGLIYTDTEGVDTLYAEIHTASGAVALVEFGFEGELLAGNIRYREIVDGSVALKGRVENQRFNGFEDGWTFAFEAYDPAGSAHAPPVRTVTNGRVFLKEGRHTSAPPVMQPPVMQPPPPPPPRTPPPPPPRTPPPPPPRRPDDGGDDDDVDVDIYIDTSGCESCDTGSGSDSGCEDSGDSGGCEGDSASSSGCEGGDTGGCEGDTASSAPDCDGCAGDTLANPSAEVQRKRAMLGMVRLAWPVGLAGWFNRRKKQRER